MSEPLLVTATYTCQNPECKKATIRDHGHEGAVFTRQNCPKCGRAMATSFHVTEVAKDGKSAVMVHRFDHGVR